MGNAAPALQPEPAPILACTVSRDVANFDLLIEDMEAELGESWGDIAIGDALAFLDQPEGAGLEFIAIAVDQRDETDLTRVSGIIARARDLGVKVILIADQLSPTALHGLLRAGADDFLPYPLPERALHDAIERLVRQPAPAPQPAEPPPLPQAAAPATPGFKPSGQRDGVVLPVHGLAGGTGASTFAVNLAWELATLVKDGGPRVCLLDFDFQMGAVATYLDLPRRESVYDMLSDTAQLDGDTLVQSMVTFGERLHVLTAPAEMLPLDIVTSEDINRVIDVARATFDFVVIDMPSAVVQWTEAVLTQAHVYFVPIELDMRSAQNTLRMIRALKAEELPLEKLRYVLNRAPKFGDLSAKGRVKRLAESLDITIELQLPDGGRQVTQANDHGLPLSNAAAKNPLRKEIQKLAKSLFDLNRAVEAGRI
ncbi:AAA family ATPase [Frigidibacter oleivorans]|uniref:AAA family ATPase n=1 Tax=Frigidibacter oleivorans TaxID=2487129 RepID=UPI000F8CD7D8|nr:AAA family ATPase [Frigidibacter oleivorans]